MTVGTAIKPLPPSMPPAKVLMFHARHWNGHHAQLHIVIHMN